MIFFTSDQHFGHANVIKYDNRPFSTVEEMDESLISHWNSVVKKDDTVYVLGDFGFIDVEEGSKIVKRLNGIKVLILGNHDRHAVSKYYNMGFTIVLSEAIVKHGQQIFKLSHYTYRLPKWKQHWIRLKTGKNYNQINKFSPTKGIETWLLHGHRHSNDILIEWDKQMISVGCYMHKYKPVSIDEIFSIIGKEKTRLEKLKRV